MYLSRVQINNFRNFKAVDVSLGPQAVIIGENRVGKTNFLHALRLVIDSSLPDSARKLKLTDIWDGHDWTIGDPQVSVHLDFSDFDSDEDLLALFTDYRLTEDATTARLSYIYQKKSTVEDAKSEADFEFRIYGGGIETNPIDRYLHQRIGFVLLHALRDAETELSTWRSSPLKILLDDAVGKVPASEINTVADSINVASTKLTELEPIHNLELSIQEKVVAFTGPIQDLKTKLGITPTDPQRLFKNLRLLIDEGKRSVSEASLGSANLLLLILKLAEYEWLREKKEHNYTILCIEEPEAHLHPHLQRNVFRKFFEEIEDEPISFFLTTHSPNIASIAPLTSITVIKEAGNESKIYSLAGLDLEEEVLEDIERYLDTCRADVLFSRGVIFVEGDAEEALVPIFAKTLGWDLDEAGIAVCNVGGAYFIPYIELVSKLNIPYSIITDWDLQSHKPALGALRAIELIDLCRRMRGLNGLTKAEKDALLMDEDRLKTEAAGCHIFLNDDTFETTVAISPGIGPALLDVLNEGGFGSLRRERIRNWKAGTTPIDGEQLLAMIADIGKGRLAARLASRAVSLPPPDYIQQAIESLR